MWTLDDGTRFCIMNPDMITADYSGRVFSHNGKKYMQIDQTGETKEITGHEKMFIKLITPIKEG